MTLETPRRAPNGAGSIYREMDRRWVGKVEIGGKRYSCRSTTYEGVRAKLDAKIREVTGAPPPSGYSVHQEWQKLRRDVLLRDGRRCRYCGAETNAVDHVIPRSAGGPDTMENLVACCNPCNARKGARLNPPTIDTTRNSKTSDR